ncbi:hypothetical protein F5890DRAFT_1495205 [Lentinula detonsa]|uniref:Uncharacterized protein n=1 Tax=Lentinula detonsa TaxID=2804962 RepID=A0AA38Q6N2_9AGAR|nr:hypothetical protein F5890DRAFT_1495205 [Lentinula detonsa]
MTRSSQTKYSPRAMKKALKRTCLDAGMSRNDTVKVSLSCLPVPKVTGTTRRNPGRMDGVRWKSDSFICPEHVDGPELRHSVDEADMVEEEVYFDANTSSDESSQTSGRMHVVSLFDIAKPAKCKGIEKEYEMVEKMREIIFLDEELYEIEEQWEDWEEIHGWTDSEMKTQKPTYAAALQGKS